MHVDD
jgi:hypothetical protein